ncbi:hypothetical protein G7Y89_g5118 [Cudoniella acicularis]|uniref:G domain-containing protein n=1 Tax=Cudoniella acicularis TaxID=354080 RepID=A0A8H4W3N8_9HELO|nr:hypothetical protein G7Y89_g5118 [Cudoniella acicularis]
MPNQMSSINEQGMVLVMGITGSGKSYFVNTLKQGSVGIGHTMDSCTSEPQIVETRIGETEVAVVDLPGFDDTHKSDVQVLSLISELVTTQYHIGMKLWGVVFLHPITDIRFQGSTGKVLSMFRGLVGEDALQNVVLATTHWGNVKDEDIPLAIGREHELRDKYWRDMLDKNAMMTRFEGSKASAEGIIAQLIGRNHVVLQLQKELVDEQMRLGKTAAATHLKVKVTRSTKECKDTIRQLKEELKGGVNNTKRLRIERSIAEAEAQILLLDSDEAKLEKRVGIDTAGALKKVDWKLAVDWQKALQIAISTLSLTFNIVNLILGGAL